jgi:uncharacterized membrane protein YphA (DoxX/SURF4 family)
MRIATLIITYLVGLVFFVFGLNYFINFMPVPPMEGDVKVFSELLHNTHYMVVVKILEILFGAMLLLNFKRPLAWLLLLPIIVNIVLFEVLIAKQPGLGIGLLLINFFMIYVHREKYKGLVN